MTESQPYFFDLDPEGLTEHVQRMGMPAYRAGQLLDWVYRKGVIDPAAMTNLSQRDRQTLATPGPGGMAFTSGTVVGHQRASDGTQKLLLAWDDRLRRLGVAEPSDGEQSLSLLDDPARQTECVMIPSQDATRARRTACVSSQVGCPVGCRFCASGLGGLDANLTAGQIVEQVWRLAQPLAASRNSTMNPGPRQAPPLREAASGSDYRITHVVFMGMGEPLANFEQVTRAVRTLMAPWGMGISGRRITISTVGLPAQMRRLAELDLPITLAISLHAPNDAIRRRIIPWAKFVAMEQILDAGRYYFERTGREITLEYILLHGVNDQPQHARELAAVARTLRSNVNLIRYNEVEPLPFARPSDGDVLAFERILRAAGVNTHIRASRGRDIAAACGQLRHEQNRIEPPRHQEHQEEIISG
ncbi:MAG: 23S rRNA (adenine(2503)-C(2))-methyltransferase RlmN [Phycisphaeraceae bacterium]